MEQVNSSDSGNVGRFRTPGRYVGGEATGVTRSHVRAVEQACRRLTGGYAGGRGERREAGAGSEEAPTRRGGSGRDGAVRWGWMLYGKKFFFSCDGTKTSRLGDRSDSIPYCIRGS